MYPHPDKACNAFDFSVARLLNHSKRLSFCFCLNAMYIFGLNTLMILPTNIHVGSFAFNVWRYKIEYVNMPMNSIKMIFSLWVLRLNSIFWVIFLWSINQGSQPDTSKRPGHLSEQNKDQKYVAYLYLFSFREIINSFWTTGFMELRRVSFVWFITPINT